MFLSLLAIIFKVPVHLVDLTNSVRNAETHKGCRNIKTPCDWGGDSHSASDRGEHHSRLQKKSGQHSSKDILQYEIAPLVLSLDFEGTNA
jgi:hypothetical protein